MTAEAQERQVSALTSFVAPYGQRACQMSEEEQVEIPAQILHDILAAMDDEEQCERGFQAISGLLVIGLRVMWSNVVRTRQRQSV